MKSQKNHVDVRGYEEWDINGKCKRRVPIETYKVGGGGDTYEYNWTRRATQEKGVSKYTIIALGSWFYDDNLEKHVQYAYMNLQA
jgi:hypothetical protein